MLIFLILHPLPLSLTISKMAGEEPFPDSVKDFVFDLHDAARRSFIPSEQQSLYSQSFREITSKVTFIICFVHCNTNLYYNLTSTKPSNHQITVLSKHSMAITRSRCSRMW